MISICILVIAVVAFRLIPSGWENFSPMAAIVLCSAAYLPKHWAIVLPFSALAISHVLLNQRYEVSLLTPYTLALLLAFGIVFGLGWALRRHRRLPLLIGSTFLASFLFYILTNTAAWIWDPAYPKTIAGWIQAHTTGNPAWSPPTWVFFRNSLIGDLFFTFLFVALYAFLPARRRASDPLRPLALDRD